MLLRIALFAIVLSGIASASAAAPIVWAGPPLSFSKPSGADFTQPAFQDALTPTTRITRGNTQGIFNIALEAAFSSTSPANTEWATDLNNPGQTIAASNFAALAFTTWTLAYASSPVTNAVGRDAVVHLVSEDIYLDLRFTSFLGCVPGGAFAYQRSTPVPEPATGALVLFGLAALAGRARAGGSLRRVRCR